MIGVYAHHHGSGHLQRAFAVAAAMDDDVTILTSADVGAGGNPDPSRIHVLPLPLDHDGPGAVAGTVDPALEPTAGGRLHWAPLRQSGLRRRTALLTGWIDTHRPTVMWTDISVEVTLATRLTGTPVVSTVLPGRRDDAPHTLAHGVCSALVAGWPRSAGAPVPAGATEPVIPVGGVSRFAGRRPEPAGRGRGRPRVLHLRGSGGSGRDQRWDAVREELGEVEWVELGGPGGRWVADPWTELCRADVVISAAGQSSVADLAAADAHVVAVPEERPFAEQDDTAGRLEALGHGAVVGRDSSVEHLVSAVRRTLERSRSTPGAGSGLREAWEIDGAAERLAAVLGTVAADSMVGAR
ncbi:MAG: glycosyltransferase [Dietzia sp.]|uniref:glycosyltransferase n=1 Tax=Dietzia sp. TaxID=1871616 RepID=UPI002728616B|nr:glycosyltransferase [Dietzia sp.]MDO8395703.1 glycosyltransferase [Dietzia sp.]